MISLPASTKQVDQSSKKIDLWQILEQKSAFSEGTIATDVLFSSNFLNLKISGQMFFATSSPLEAFFENEYLSPIKTELDYIEQRVNLISKCKNLAEDFDKNSPEFLQLEEIIWLLKFQLYGFGQKLISDGKTLYGLISLKESGTLEKEKIRQKLEKLALKFPSLASTIFEFL